MADHVEQAHASASRICVSPAWARASCAASPMRFAARACARRWCCCKFAGVFAAEPIEKLLRSAVANAENNHDMNTDELYIARITVDGGPGGRFTKRLDPRAQGRAYFKRKRMSHVTIVVSEQPPAKPRKQAPRSVGQRRSAYAPRAGRRCGRLEQKERTAQADRKAAEAARGSCGVNMGQKIHPVGLRLGITRTWDSRWFEKKHYIDWLHEDVAIRKFFERVDALGGDLAASRSSAAPIRRA